MNKPKNYFYVLNPYVVNSGKLLSIFVDCHKTKLQVTNVLYFNSMLHCYCPT